MGVPQRVRTARRWCGATTLALAVTAVLAWGGGSPTAYAAFQGTSTSSTSSFSAGRVQLSHDRTTAVFTTRTAVRPGDFESVCLTATSSGNLAAEVRLYAAATSSTALAPAIDVSVDGPLTTSCTTSALTTYTPTLTEPLSTFLTGHTSWSTGITGWSPTGSGVETRYYRISYQLTRGAGATSKACTFALVLEGQNT